MKSDERLSHLTSSSTLSENTAGSLLERNVLVPLRDAFIEDIARPARNLFNSVVVPVTGTSLGEIVSESPPQAPSNSAEYVSRLFCRGAVGAITYAICGRFAGGALRVSARAMNLETGAFAKVAASESTAQILGAAVHDFYIDAPDTRGRAGNVTASIVSFGTFESCNRFSRGRPPLARILMLAPVGAIGSASGLAARQLVAGETLTHESLSQSMLDGAVLNLLLPAAQTQTARLVDSFNVKIGRGVPLERYMERYGLDGLSSLLDKQVDARPLARIQPQDGDAFVDHRNNLIYLRSPDIASGAQRGRAASADQAAASAEHGGLLGHELSHLRFQKENEKAYRNLLSIPSESRNSIKEKYVSLRESEEHGARKIEGVIAKEIQRNLELDSGRGWSLFGKRQRPPFSLDTNGIPVSESYLPRGYRIKFEHEFESFLSSKGTYRPELDFALVTSKRLEELRSGDNPSDFIFELYGDRLSGKECEALTLALQRWKVDNAGQSSFDLVYGTRSNTLRKSLYWESVQRYLRSRLSGSEDPFSISFAKDNSDLASSIDRCAGKLRSMENSSVSDREFIDHEYVLKAVSILGCAGGKIDTAQSEYRRNLKLAGMEFKKANECTLAVYKSKIKSRNEEGCPQQSVPPSQDIRLSNHREHQEIATSLDQGPETFHGNITSQKHQGVFGKMEGKDGETYRVLGEWLNRKLEPFAAERVRQKLEIMEQYEVMVAPLTAVCRRYSARLVNVIGLAYEPLAKQKRESLDLIEDAYEHAVAPFIEKYEKLTAPIVRRNVFTNTAPEFDYSVFWSRPSPSRNLPAKDSGEFSPAKSQCLWRLGDSLNGYNETLRSIRNEHDDFILSIKLDAKRALRTAQYKREEDIVSWENNRDKALQSTVNETLNSLSYEDGVSFAGTEAKYIEALTQSALGTSLLLGKSCPDLWYRARLRQTLLENARPVEPPLNFFLKNRDLQKLAKENQNQHNHELQLLLSTAATDGVLERIGLPETSFKNAVLKVKALNLYPLARNLELAVESFKANLSPKKHKQAEDIFLSTMNMTNPFPAELAWTSGGLRGRFIPKSDPRGLFLGDHTASCMRMTGANETGVIWAQKNENAGFFVVENRCGEIVAGSRVWRVPEENGICFNSIQSRGAQGKDASIVSIYKAAASTLVRDGMAGRVVLGGLRNKVNVNQLQVTESLLSLPKDLSGLDDCSVLQFDLAGNAMVSQGMPPPND